MIHRTAGRSRSGDARQQGSEVLLGRSASIRPGRASTDGSYSRSRPRIRACETRISARPAWRTSRSSSPSSVTTSRTSAAWRDGSHSAVTSAIPQLPKGHLPRGRPERAGGTLDSDFVECTYDDEILPDGFLYAYRSGAIDQPEQNPALRAAYELGTDRLLHWNKARLVQAGAIRVTYERTTPPAGWWLSLRET